MDQRDQKEERNKRIGWLTSVAVQLVLIVLFYFIIAWKEPSPPIPEYGIELGFSASAGAPAAAPSQEVVESEEEAEETTDDNSVEESEPIESDSPEEVFSDQELSEIEETNPIETETPVKVEETKPKSQEVVNEPKEEPQNNSEPAEEEAEIVDSRAVMSKPSDSEAENESTSDEDSQEEEKELDQRAIYGSQGSDTGNTEGANLSLSGWIWDFKPRPNDTSDESGKIVYKVVVDGDGYLIKIETLTSSVSPSVERKYRQEVEKLTFSKTADYKTASVSTGTITFIIKSR